MTLLEFSRQYSMPKTIGTEPTRRGRRIVIIPRPYVSPDPVGDKYEQYCGQSLMQHKCFRHINDLLSGYDSYIDAYAAFLWSGHIPPCLEDDMYRRLISPRVLKMTVMTQRQGSVSLFYTCMYIILYCCGYFIYCTLLIPHYRNSRIVLPPLHHNQRNADLQPSVDTQEDIDWTLAAQSYPNLEEAPRFMTEQRQAAGQHTITTTADPRNLQGKQLQVYTIVQQHQSAISPPPLRMIVSGTAGTDREIIPHPLPPTSPAETACGYSSDWCGCLQHRWPHPPLPPQPAH